MKKIWFDAYIIEVLMRDLVGHDRKPSCFIVFIYFWAETNSMRQRCLTASLHDIAVETGLSKSAVQSALRVLKRRRLIRAERDTVTSKPTFYILTPWRRPRTVTVASKPAAAKR
jgi:DNA-binding transcriptional ArsR family regulator